MDLGISNDKIVAEICWFYCDPKGKFGTKQDVLEADRYTLHVKSGKRPCFLNEAAEYKPMVIVSRKINERVIHISAWKEMPLKAGDRIHALWLGTMVRPKIGGLLPVPPSAPEAYIDSDGHIQYRGVTKNWVTEFFNTGAIAKFQKKESEFKGFSRTGGLRG
jgi:hypothetical protein